MHAVLVSVTVDDGKQDEARQGLNERIIPMLKSAPGFIAGYWLAPEGNKGWSTVIFDTEENARAAAPSAGRQPGAPVTVDFVEFREVVASA